MPRENVTAQEQISYLLTAQAAKKLRQIRMTAAEWNIWSYLAVLDPSGEKAVAVDIESIIKECSVSKATAYRAFSKLQKAGLFEIQAKGLTFKQVTEAGGV